MPYKTANTGIPPPRVAGLAGALLAALVLASPASCAPQSGLYRTDARRTGRTPYECTLSPQLKWSFGTSAGCSASPVVAENGTVYFGSYNKRLYAVSTSGTEVWSYSSNSLTSATAAISSDGTIYFPTTSGYLYSLRSDGVLNWAVSPAPGYSMTCSPLVAADGRIYVGSESRYVSCLNSDGTLRWSYCTGGGVRYGLSMSPDGSVVYAPSADGRIYALDASSGAFKWKSPVISPGNVCAVGNDGAIYVGGTDFNLYVLNPNGTIRWSRPTAGKITAAPAIGLDGTIYCGSQDRWLYAMNPNGSLKWTRSVSGVIYSSPTIDPYGTLVLGNYGGDLIAVNAANGSTLWERALGQNLYSSPTVGGGGSVFIIDSSGRLSKFSGLLQHPDIPEPSSLLVLAWSLGAGAAMIRFAGRRRTRASR